MTEHPHEETRRLFDLVIDAPADERDAALDRECGGDADLKQRVLHERERWMSTHLPGSILCVSSSTAMKPAPPYPIANIELGISRRVRT
jgi:hypothetical protein